MHTKYDMLLSRLLRHLALCLIGLIFCFNIGNCIISEQQRNTLLQYAYLHAYFTHKHQFTCERHHQLLMELKDDPAKLAEVLNYLESQDFQQHNIDTHAIDNIIDYLEHPYIPDTSLDLFDLMPSTQTNEYTTAFGKFAISHLLARVKSGLQSRSSTSLNIIGWDIIHGGIDYGIDKYGLIALKMHTTEDYFFYHKWLLSGHSFDENDNVDQDNDHTKTTAHSSFHSASKAISKQKRPSRYKCNYPNCDKSYTENGSLKVHQARKHQADNGVITQFDCEYEGCDKTYKCKASLKVHQQRKHLN